MGFLIILLNILEYTLMIYFGGCTVYILFFAIAGLFPSRKKIPAYDEDFKKIAVLIPAYREDSVIIRTAKNALRQDYPKDKYDIIIIADSFQQSTLELLRCLRVNLKEVSFEKSTKTKALNAAMNGLSDDYDIAVVLDADNLMQDDLLKKINSAFFIGAEIIQCHRVALNTDTSFALLDAISEEINNHIFRKGHRNAGLSAALIGSGMAFDYTLFRRIMSQITAVGGFDKELEIRLLREKKQIRYLGNAFVFDEKVQKAEVFSNQRRRWLSAQFIYFGRFFPMAVKELFLRGNIDLFDKIIQMILPPRVLHLGISVIILIIYTFLHFLFPGFSSMLSSGPVFWAIITLLTIATLMISVPLQFYSTRTLNAALSLPKAFLLMLKALFRLRGANRRFIHTTHGNITGVR